jgi:tRNA1(Val) A37 N6-methylase TrmN6
MVINNTLTLYQPQDGYCYNSDTHLLYAFICDQLSKFKNINGELLDIGSGSGILGLLVARDYKRLQLNQCEIQDIFEKLTLKNSEVNNIQSNMYKGSILDIKFDKHFDIIVSNPPFYHNSVLKSTNENIKIARYNDDLSIDKFLTRVASLLTQNGKFFFCYDAKQIDEIMVVCRKLKLNIESIKFLHPKDGKVATIVMVDIRKNSKALMQVSSPFVMFDKNGDFRSEILDIYERCATHSIKVDMGIKNDKQ